MYLKDNSLTPDVFAVIRNQVTEKPYFDSTEVCKPGTYLCRACGLSLFRSSMKFQSFCGWPSFDSIIANTVATELDKDGVRLEIHCARCRGHLGHVFHGERFTERNIRYCVNTASLDFVENLDIFDTEELILAAGCFWGVEHYFQQIAGVVKTEVGYTGGKISYPSYSQVCSGNTGHVEAVRIVYDAKQIDLKLLVNYFFAMHDATLNLDSQYQSAIFYYDNYQKQVTTELALNLESKGSKIVTQIRPVQVFWPAKAYHQNYIKNRYLQS